MNWLKKIALITAYLLMAGLLRSQTLSVIDGDTLVCITVQQMDTISSKLIRCKENNALHALLLAKNSELGACYSLVAKDAALIDTLKAQVSDYARLDQVKEQEKAALSGMIKQQKKTIRRVKLMTGVIVAPVSFVFGGILALIIVR